jgi:hypothetical protein
MSVAFIRKNLMKAHIHQGAAAGNGSGETDNNY